MQSRRCAVLCLVIVAAISAGLVRNDSARAVERNIGRVSRRSVTGNAEHQSVELFRAIEDGDVEVRLIPKNPKLSTVLVKNKSDKPLTIKMPEAFAGVPVLAQGFNGGGDVGGDSSNSSNQSIGGGLGGGGLGGGGGGGLFNVPPDSVRKIRVNTVCLEHGKPDPNPRVPYVLKPIESYTKDKKVIELCKMLGRGEIDQHAAQAGAWHLTDSLSWQQLAAKVRIRHLNGSAELMFGPRDLLRANQMLRNVERRVTDEMQLRSPGESETESYFGPVDTALR